MRDQLERLAVEAEAQATECSLRGDTEGTFYARGLRDAYRTAAAAIGAAVADLLAAAGEVGR